MNKVINKKIGIVLLSAILLLAVIVTPFPEATATHKDGAEHGGGGPGGGPGGGDPGDETPVLVCNGTFGDDMDPEAPDPLVFDGNVVVQDGDLCNLYAMTQSILITGDLKVAAGGELWVYGEYASEKTITIEGSIMAEGADETHIKDVTVGGDVTIKDNVYGFLLADSTITGHVKLNGNSHAYSVVGNYIGGALALSNNEGGGYPMFFNLSDNIITGNAACKNNDPAPSGDSNTAEGKITGQCKVGGLVVSP